MGGLLLRGGEITKNLQESDSRVNRIQGIPSIRGYHVNHASEVHKSGHRTTGHSVET